MEQKSLFEDDTNQPLASRLRPRNLDEFVGQKHLIGEGKVLRKLIESDKISSIIFWGNPGIGKTTLAQIIANKTNSEFINFSAVTSGIKEIKAVMAHAENNRKLGQKTIVYADDFSSCFLNCISYRALYVPFSTFSNCSCVPISATSP